MWSPERGQAPESAPCETHNEWTEIQPIVAFVEGYYFGRKYPSLN